MFTSMALCIYAADRRMFASSPESLQACCQRWTSLARPASYSWGHKMSILCRHPRTLMACASQPAGPRCLLHASSHTLLCWMGMIGLLAMLTGSLVRATHLDADSLRWSGQIGASRLATACSAGQVGCVGFRQTGANKLTKDYHTGCRPCCLSQTCAFRAATTTW